MHAMYLCTCTLCMYVCACVHAVCVHGDMYACVHVCMYVRVHGVCVHTYMCIW